MIVLEVAEFGVFNLHAKHSHLRFGIELFVLFSDIFLKAQRLVKIF